MRWSPLWHSSQFSQIKCAYDGARENQGMTDVIVEDWRGEDRRQIRERWQGRDGRGEGSSRRLTRSIRLTTLSCEFICIFIVLVWHCFCFRTPDPLFAILKQTAGVRSAIGQQQHPQSCITHLRNHPFPFPCHAIVVIITFNLTSARIATVFYVDVVVCQINK